MSTIPHWHTWSQSSRREPNQSLFAMLSPPVLLSTSILLHFFLWASAPTVALQGNIPASELNALWSLYNSTDGANWVWNDPLHPNYFNGAMWNFTPSANPCADQWQGVTCNESFVLNTSHVCNLTLPFHGLRGSLPAEIGQLTQLQVLYLETNTLSGSIPAVIGQLPHLRVLVLSYNKLSGSIPPVCGQLTQLQVLALSFNKLTGSVAVDIGQLTQLQVLDMESNKLSGIIPAEIGQLRELQLLVLSYNKLSGTIPVEIGQLTQLQVLYLDTNGLSGSIPAELGQLTQLQTIDLFSNELSGSIPAVIGQLVHLQVLVFSYNKLTGSLPAEMQQLTRLQILYLDYNKLSGSIVASFGQLLFLEVLALESNLLSGSIPAMIGQLTQLQALYLASNQVSGCIPAEIGDLLHLVVLELDTNQLRGIIPAEIGQLALLEYLNIADNAFTGNIPDELFQLTNLSALIAGKNCFEGMLPQAVCGARALVSLNLDGLHTARQCSKRQVPFTYVYGGAQAFHGTIPACVLDLPLLTSLHLSGSGLTGTIPANLSADAVLTDLVLSHNSLVGHIPASIQLRAWDTLDLSYNWLDGTLLTSFGDGGPISGNASASIFLKNNRLSGCIPSFLVHLKDVDILGSNLFSCGADRSDLPVHDEDKDRYQCGANAFVGHLFAALLVMGALVGITLAFRWHCSKRMTAAARFAETWFREARLSLRNLPLGVAFLSTISALLCDVAMWSALVTVVCLLPWYAAAHSQYGTYTHTYAWVVSAAFLSGLVPAVTELALYCALMVAVVIGGALLVEISGNAPQQGKRSAGINSQLASSSSVRTAPPRQWYPALLHALFFVCTLTVVLLVNVTFVAASLQADQVGLAFAQIFFTAFKLYWNMVCTPYLIDLVTVYTGRERVSPRLVTIHMLLSVVNNIVIPCLVVAVQSPSCFLNVFQASSTVTAEYSVPGCDTSATASTDGSVFETVCSPQFPVPLSLQFQPHFSYSYQCSSSFITYYSPVFVLMGLTAGVLIPVAKAVNLYCLTRAVPGTWWHQVLSAAVPRILRPIPASVAPPLDQAASPSTPAAMLRRLREERVFNGVTAVSALTTYLGILLTFGVVFPPLAVIMCATMWSAHWQTRLKLGKFVHDAQAAGAVHLIERLEQDCRSVVSLQTLRRVMFLITCICCCFYALFLFDTLGDAWGAADSYWIFLVMALFPGALYVLSRVHRARNVGRASGYVDENIVEMVLVDPAQQPEELSSQEANAAASQPAKSLSAGSDNNIVDSDSTLSALHYNP